MVVLGGVLDLKHHLSVRVERLNLLAPENTHIRYVLDMKVFQEVDYLKYCPVAKCIL